jgi:hypothetical protein
MDTSTPRQYSPLGQIFKKFLHTRLGARLAYFLGVSGFNRIDAVIVRANGSRERLWPSFNSRVDAGAALVSSLISGTTLGGISSPSSAKYIALSTSNLTPAKSDATLSGETASSGMARALATAGTYSAPSALDGAASYILTKTFTATGAITIVSTGIFDAASSGNLLAEANLASSAALSNGDTLTINWLVNI